MAEVHRLQRESGELPVHQLLPFSSCPGLAQLPGQSLPLNPAKNKKEPFKRSINNPKLKDTQTQARVAVPGSGVDMPDKAFLSLL